MKARFNDPQRLVPLGEVADLINEVFGDEVGAPVLDATPYAWWDRSKKNQDISLPMPEPSLDIPGKPLWRQEVLLHWFGAWRSIEVPRGVPFGDRVDTRGRDVPSPYRVL